MGTNDSNGFTADGKCVLQIFSTGVDTAPWYALWEAVVATFTVCVSAKRAGSSRGVGKYHEPVDYQP